MYKELNKYKKDEKVDGIGVLPNKEEITIKQDQYVAPMGDLINDFMNHKNKPFWKRKYYHDHLTDIYLRWLNQVNIYFIA